MFQSYMQHQHKIVCHHREMLLFQKLGQAVVGWSDLFVVTADVNVKIIVRAGVADVVVLVALEVVVARAVKVIVVICVWGWELENKNIWKWIRGVQKETSSFWLGWVCPSLLLICEFKWNWCNIFFEVALDKTEVYEFL